MDSQTLCSECFVFKSQQDHVCTGIEGDALAQSNAKLQNMLESIRQYTAFLSQNRTAESNPGYGFGVGGLAFLQQWIAAVLKLTDIPKSKQESDRLNHLQSQAENMIGLMNDGEEWVSLIKNMHRMLVTAVQAKVKGLTDGLSQEEYVMPNEELASHPRETDEDRRRRFMALKIADMQPPNMISKPVIQPCDKIHAAMKVAPLEHAPFSSIQLEEYSMRRDAGREHRYSNALDHMKSVMQVAKSNVVRQFSVTPFGEAGQRAQGRIGFGSSASGASYPIDQLSRSVHIDSSYQSDCGGSPRVAVPTTPLTARRYTAVPPSMPGNSSVPAPHPPACFMSPGFMTPGSVGATGFRTIPLEQPVFPTYQGVASPPASGYATQRTPDHGIVTKGGRVISTRRATECGSSYPGSTQTRHDGAPVVKRTIVRRIKLDTPYQMPIPSTYETVTNAPVPAEVSTPAPAPIEPTPPPKHETDQPSHTNAGDDPLSESALNLSARGPRITGDADRPVAPRQRSHTQPLADPGARHGPMGSGNESEALRPQLNGDEMCVRNSCRLRDLAREEQRAAASGLSNDLASTSLPSTCLPDPTKIPSQVVKPSLVADPMAQTTRAGEDTTAMAEADEATSTWEEKYQANADAALAQMEQLMRMSQSKDNDIDDILDKTYKQDITRACPA